MEPRTPLMPYGAPELQAAARPNLAKATTLSSGLASAAFLAAIAIAPWLAAHVVTVELQPKSPRLEAQQNFEIERPRPVMPSGIVAASANAGMPVPVPDFEAPAVAPSTGSESIEPPPSDLDWGMTASGPAASTSERLPALGEYVFVEELPELISIPKTHYSQLGIDAGVTGRVVVHVLVGKEGRVLNVQVDSRYSIPVLNEAALESARQAVFTPAMSQGHPVIVWVKLPFDFRLD